MESMRAGETNIVLLLWSGGKDAMMALEAVREEGRYEVAALVCTTVAGEVAGHGVPASFVAEQAEALHLPLEIVRFPEAPDNEEYAAGMEEVIMPFRRQGVETVITGDLFLEDIRAFREQQLQRLGMRLEVPLWGTDPGQLAASFLARGYRALVTCVDTEQLAPSFVGRTFSRRMLEDLPPQVDHGGERGAFHTYVYAGPLLDRPIPIRATGRRDRRSMCCAELKGSRT